MAALWTAASDADNRGGVRMTDMACNWNAHLCCAVIVILVAPCSLAEPGYEIRAGAAHTDNLLRGDTDGVEETIGIVGATLDLSLSSKRFEGSLIGDVTWQHYSRTEYEDELRPDLRGILEWRLLSDNLKWIFDNRFGQLSSDPFGVDSLLNREYVNRFETGPDILLAIAGRTALELSGRFADTKFEVSESDNQRVSADLAIVQALSSFRQISVHARTESIDFDDPGFRDFDRRRAYAQFESKVPRGSLKLIAGINEVEYEDDVIDGPLIEIDFSRRVRSSATVNLRYWRGLTDTSDQFGRSSAEIRDPSSGQPASVYTDTYETEQVSISVGRARENSSVSIGYYWAQDEFANATEFDSERRGYTFGFEHGFASGWRIGMSGFTETRDFRSAGLDDDNLEITLEIRRRLTQTLSLSIGYLYADRDSGSPTNTYAENRYSIGLAYRPKAASDSDSE